eukprot:TRINITY_DN1973_c0_g1_i6.p1 TRINITY_DN1973_c0_g1~~TRINITY_DN1973_c0_g1_i6.p1  ORF type:complete len:298 (+),score=51.88 TRINITY_DN1973_c0_g1_i6:133-1026(+)
MGKGSGKGSSDDVLAGVFQMSCRCVCLIVTMVLLLTLVGYAFVAIQAIWSQNLGDEVDQLERTNALLEQNNERFKASNERLEVQVDKLRANVEALHDQIGNFTQMNSELENEIQNLNSTKVQLDSTASNMEDQGDRLQSEVGNLKNETESLQDTVQQLNSTSMDLQDQLQQFRELETSIGKFVNTSSNSFNEILDNTRALYDEYITSTLTGLEVLLQAMLNNIEFSDSKQGFSRSEYTEWLTRVSYVVPETAQQLLQKYPYGASTTTATGLQTVIDDIIQKQRQELEQRVVSSGNSF